MRWRGGCGGAGRVSGKVSRPRCMRVVGSRLVGAGCGPDEVKRVARIRGVNMIDRVTVSLL